MLSIKELIYKQIPWVDWPTCDPNTLGKRIVGDKAVTTEYHCRRLACPICGPVLTTLRARKLMYELTKEGWPTLWWGEVDDAALISIRRYALRHPSEKRLVTLYFESPDLRTILATTNMVPRRKLLQEVSKNDAVVNYWYKYAMNFGLRKNPHDDWNITDNKWIDWVDDGPKWDVIETDQRMDRLHGYVPGTIIDDPDKYKQRFRRIRGSISNPDGPEYPG